jgi:hypothetical protein
VDAAASALRTSPTFDPASTPPAAEACLTNVNNGGQTPNVHIDVNKW